MHYSLTIDAQEFSVLVDVVLAGLKDALFQYYLILHFYFLYSIT